MAPSFLDLSHYFPTDSIRAGFSLRPFPFQSPQDRIELAKQFQLNSTHLIIPEQVHSGTVQVVSKSRSYSKTDGLISNNLNDVLSIQVADCVPVFIADISNQIIGLIHAGWRGVTANIIENGIEKLRMLGADIRNTHVILGPSIRNCCFEVGPEVAKHFPAHFIRRGNQDRSFIDLNDVIKEKLLNGRIFEAHIHFIDECTCCHPDKYHSYRRDGNRSGRMIAVFGLNDR